MKVTVLNRRSKLGHVQEFDDSVTEKMKGLIYGIFDEEGILLNLHCDAGKRNDKMNIVLSIRLRQGNVLKFEA